MLKFACLATLLLTPCAPALAAYDGYPADNNGAAVLMLIVLAAIVGGIVFAMVADAPRKPPPSQTPEQARAEAEHYNAQATRLGAKRRAVDAETDLKRSLIEAARAESEFQETREIVQHDKAVRALEQQNVRRLK